MEGNRAGAHDTRAAAAAWERQREHAVALPVAPEARVLRGGAVAVDAVQLPAGRSKLLRRVDTTTAEHRDDRPVAGGDLELVDVDEAGALFGDGDHVALHNHGVSGRWLHVCGWIAPRCT